MERPPPGGTRGILRPRTGLERFQIERIPPRAALAPFVANFWVLRWDLRGRPPHRQQVLTRPSVHITFTSYLTEGATRARIVGVVRDDFAEEIHDEGHVIGAAFRPGGFRPFMDAPVATLTGRFAGVEEVFGADGTALAAEIFACADAAEAVGLLEAFLTGRGPAPDPSAERAAVIVDRIAARPGLVRVDELAAEAGLSPRSLQRLFHEYVGIGPKWVIRRFRMQEAAERAASGADVDWAELAAELGYADQAHFVRDFTASVGTPPARYARETGPGSIGG
ncbi:helix-turn-helix domain-containing protein [Actinomadura madurae]|uniref:helix-turn-helix domain-containing protein n=2 Tax=Actinomadura madurae TaxID=1993 RepID=UPI002025F559|nr:helix-turn-helix domain-containing protein [Actinomadura madurae]URN01341.1 helix-turn-helix domain-containing protein [Actinomadura madurae]URN03452.1 helix-turn-helix domain-containing protein [Actinomadura madurae]